MRRLASVKDLGGDYKLYGSAIISLTDNTIITASAAFGILGAISEVKVIIIAKASSCEQNVCAAVKFAMQIGDEYILGHPAGSPYALAGFIKNEPQIFVLDEPVIIHAEDVYTLHIITTGLTSLNLAVYVQFKCHPSYDRNGVYR